MPILFERREQAVNGSTYNIGIILTGASPTEKYAICACDWKPNYVIVGELEYGSSEQPYAFKRACLIKSTDIQGDIDKLYTRAADSLDVFGARFEHYARKPQGLKKEFPEASIWNFLLGSK